MTIDSVAAQPQRRGRSLLKIALYGGCFSAALLAGAHYGWKMSGSGEWRLVSDQEGVQVYEMKQPGSAFKRFKATMRMKSTMNRVIAGMMDRDLKSCAEWNPGCVEEQTVQPWDQQERSFVHFYRVNLPAPMAPREFLLKAQFTPEFRDQSVFIQFTAMPDELPRNDCCHRVAHMNNKWKFTPRGDGEIGVAFTQDMDIGLPYFVYNFLAPEFVHQGLLSLPRIVNQPKYDQENALFTATPVPSAPTLSSVPLITPPLTKAFATVAIK